MVNISKGKGKRKKDEAAKSPDQKKPKKNEDCFFCMKPEHVKKERTKYHAWRAKKGMFFTLVYSQVNLASVSKNT